MFPCSAGIRTLSDGPRRLTTVRAQTCSSWPDSSVRMNPAAEAQLLSRPFVTESASFDDPKIRVRAFAWRRESVHSAIQCRQASRMCLCKRQEAGIGRLPMPCDPHAVREGGCHTIHVIGPEPVAVDGGDIPQQGDRRGRRIRVEAKAGLEDRRTKPSWVNWHVAKPGEASRSNHVWAGS